MQLSQCFSSVKKSHSEAILGGKSGPLVRSYFPDKQTFFSKELPSPPTSFSRESWEYCLMPWVSNGSSHCSQSLMMATPHSRALSENRERRLRELWGSSSSLLLAGAAVNLPWLALTTCLKALQCRKEIFQEIKLLLFPVWLSSLVYEKKNLKGTWKEICLNSWVVVIHPPLQSGFGQFPQESGWLGPMDLSMA